MFVRTLLRAIRPIALLVIVICLSLSIAAADGWKNDVDQLGNTAGTGNPVVGFGGSVFFFSEELGGTVIRRWPPLPGQSDPELIAEVSGGGLLAIRDGYLYVSYVTWIINGVSGEVNPHGIAKINLQTYEITDAVSVNPDPVPYAITWDHNGTMYIAGDSWTGTGNHQETNLFKKWSGSQWLTVGGGLVVDNSAYSKALRLGTDGTNIYVGGAFLGAKNGTTNIVSTNIIRWNVNSGLWTGMAGYGLSEWPTGIAVSGTNVLVAGGFSTGVKRYSNIDASALSIGTANATSSDIAVLNGIFYLAGDFTTIGGVSTAGIAKWDGSSWSALSSGLSGGTATGDDLAVNGNSVFLIGDFTSAGGLSTPYGKARWQIGADQPLRFTSGSVSGTNVTLNLAGIPTMICQVQRLDFPSDTWVSQGTLELNGSGTGTFNSSVTNGLGYFRAKSRDGAYLSTNAFGSIVGTVPPGYWLVGTPFAGMTASNMFPTPYGGTTVYYQTNGSLSSVTWDDLDEIWSPSDRAFAAGEGVVVQTASGTNNFAYQAYGLFWTNFSRTLPTNYSIIASPLYHKLAGGSATQIDEFNTTRLGGYSLVPVNSGSNPKARADRNKAGVANQYINYTLTTGSQWQTNSTNTTVPILIGEGVWIENRHGVSTNWSVTVPIW